MTKDFLLCYSCLRCVIELFSKFKHKNNNDWHCKTSFCHYSDVADLLLNCFQNTRIRMIGIWSQDRNSLFTQDRKYCKN